MDIKLLDTPFFGIIISLLAFNIGLYIFEKSKKFPLLNPLVTSGAIIIIFIKLFNIPLSYYEKGGNIIAFFLAPATVALSMPLYRQINKLKENFLPIIIGSLVGAVTAIISIIFLGKLLGIDEILIKSFIPKSITTPLGMELSALIGGIPPITVFAIILTGISGNAMAPYVCKIFRIEHPVAKGLGIGISSHAVGTAKAIEMGEVEGAMSALSIVIAGIITFIVAPILLILI
ncbi:MULTISPECIES: LrgB family protein [Fusobacterium]|uniref:LrgB family protein n=1 Tax=Fusobacterium TaxID=848 RepID=UPI001476FBEF|nr:MULTISPECIES: LrgB family protein [Fusobacterium]NME35447.1 LrgB family protein [Fusobacterium sp. FSA-380-WT-3A]